MRDQVIAGMQVATGLDPASLSSFLDAMQALSYGPPLRDATSLSGLGSVSVSKRAARTGRNPQTGKEIKIAAKKVVKFKAGA
ncbi:MAG: DNA-binding protein, partial [Deltaproteobacteria bacterium]